METNHRIIIGDARDLSSIPSQSVDLVVTSPPYPMIQMWDETFASMSADIKSALETGDGPLAFELMHRELDRAWDEAYRVLKSGGIMCVNVGDATRKIGEDFQVYPSHARILSHAISMGLQVLPWIIWKKPTNSPSKFMGSGMLPPGAYVTLEHEYILILRKGGLRKFRTATEKQVRRESAYFWEERNQWFADVWSDLPGASQALDLGMSRKRSAAFPLGLPLRLIRMYSVYGDTVLDPFVGTGTTTIAAILTARNSIGVDADPKSASFIDTRIKAIPEIAEEIISQRIADHLSYIEKREQSSEKTQMKYVNRTLHCPVMTRQETGIRLYRPVSVKKLNEGEYMVQHELYSSSPSSIEPVR